MTPWRQAVVATGVLVALLLVVTAAAGHGGGPDRHRDGDGPLAGFDGPVSESMSIDASFDGGREFTYGTRLCHSGDGPAPVIRSIGASATVGSGFAYLGSLVRTFTWTSDHTAIGSVTGFPPPAEFVAPDIPSDPVGYAVLTPCDATLEEGYTELLVGLALTGPDGGGWEGILVEYEVNDRVRVVEIQRGMKICGISVPDCE
jgi:hypothetical protein